MHSLADLGLHPYLNKAATNMYLRVLLQNLLSMPLSPHPELEVLSYMVILLLNSFTFKFCYVYGCFACIIYVYHVGIWCTESGIGS